MLILEKAVDLYCLMMLTALELSRGLRIVQAVVSVPTTVVIVKMLEYDVCPCQSNYRRADSV